jgi:Sulfotransferase domain
MLPGFLIVGAQRAGTTTMHRVLSQHPGVLKPVLHKEVHYFDDAYERKLGWYRAHFPLVARARWIERSRGIAPVAFEASPYYMFHPLAGERIAHDLPDVKLLVLVRDPVERAHSAHAHEVTRGHEDLPFEAALELEDSRLEGEVERILADPRYISRSHRHHAYLARGRYIEQLEHLEALFGRERIHVIDSGDFFTQPKRVYDAALEFLELPHRGYPSFPRENARPRAPMPDSLRHALDAHFVPFDERLAKWLGHDPSWRR